MTILTSLKEISIAAANKQHENDAFATFLRAYDSQVIDKLVAQLNNDISAKVDCTQCGNCCKTLMIQVEPDEITALADEMRISDHQFEEKYIEKGSSGNRLINTIPCHFLSENKCSIYALRFSGCREFPALHLPHFTLRLFTTFMHYDRCPIIFNVIESLKGELSFSCSAIE